MPRFVGFKENALDKDNLEKKFQNVAMFLFLFLSFKSMLVVRFLLGIILTHLILKSLKGTRTVFLI